MKIKKERGKGKIIQIALMVVIIWIIASEIGSASQTLKLVTNNTINTRVADQSSLFDVFGLGSTSLDYPVNPSSFGVIGFVSEESDGDGYYNAQDFSGESNHMGEDWNGDAGGDTDLGDPIYAMGDGVVYYVGDAGSSGGGNNIGISHVLPNGGTVRSVYVHLHYESMNVVLGDAVTRGQKIAEIGKGYQDTQYPAHLHFEIRLDATKEPYYIPYKLGLGRPFGFY